MPKTRSKPATKAQSVANPDSVAEAPKLPTRDVNPPKLFILPTNITKEAKIVSLPNPANRRVNRYVFGPSSGLYEFTRIAAPKSAPRSWLLKSNKANSTEVNGHAGDGIREEQGPGDQAIQSHDDYIISQPDLFVATALDELYFLLPIISAASNANTSRYEGQKHLFLTIDDHIERLGSQGTQLAIVANNSGFRTQLEKRAADVCDVQEAGDESMYRLSEEKLFHEVLAKSRRMVTQGLPPSIEERFVKRPLQPPVSNVIMSNSQPQIPSLGQEESTLSQAPTLLSQESSLISESATPTTLTQATSFSTEIEEEVVIVAQPAIALASEDIYNLLRLRTAFDFILRSYIPSHLRPGLTQRLESSQSTSVDDATSNFSALDAYLEKLTSLRSEAVALRAMSDNVSRKRSANSGLDDEAAEARAEKKRKKEEEELKEKNKSRALKTLKKVNITGMKTMDSFFTKAAKKTKS